RGHHGQRCAGDGVVEDEQVDGPWQVVLAVVGVGAVPLHTGAAEAAADVGGHSHEATVGTVGGHAFVLRVIREVDLRAVGVRGRACHAVVAVGEQDEGFLHRLDARGEVGDTGVDHLFLVEVEEVDAGRVGGCLVSSV